jgi:uncharacterized tellurite resistance protein B-like protein
MGIFDTDVHSTNSTHVYTPQSQQEAWVAIMYACMAVDGEISSTEIDKMCELLIIKKLFTNKDIADYYELVMKAHNLAGSRSIIDNSVSLVDVSDKPTLFALTMEILLADGILGDNEKKIAEYLSIALELSDDMAKKIVDVMLLKNKGNFIIVN